MARPCRYRRRKLHQIENPCRRLFVSDSSAPTPRPSGGNGNLEPADSMMISSWPHRDPPFFCLRFAATKSQSSNPAMGEIGVALCRLLSRRRFVISSSILCRSEITRIPLFSQVLTDLFKVESIQRSKESIFDNNRAAQISPGSMGSNKGNSSSLQEKFVVIIIWSWLVVVDSSDPFAWLELGSSCFDFDRLDWDRERGSISWSSDLSLLHANGRLWDPI
ncbi:vacuolar protein-sorting-associated protein [Striga asiatica]|uniref:Vacuolar protein-sorting-associated protein n=1 Tax=Striga asiatica TaxID=4170 RepID=A0A5A7R4D7_STRAF|nr:vacuolar protein-sorting-associated protein [Striga asiatica]